MRLEIQHATRDGCKATGLVKLHDAKIAEINGGLFFLPFARFGFTGATSVFNRPFSAFHLVKAVTFGGTGVGGGSIGSCRFSGC